MAPSDFLQRTNMRFLSRTFCSCECHRGELNLSDETENSSVPMAISMHASAHTDTHTHVNRHSLTCSPFICSFKQPKPTELHEHRGGCWGLREESEAALALGEFLGSEETGSVNVQRPRAGAAVEACLNAWAHRGAESDSGTCRDGSPFRN